MSLKPLPPAVIRSTIASPFSPSVAPLLRWRIPSCLSMSALTPSVRIVSTTSGNPAYAVTASSSSVTSIVYGNIPVLRLMRPTKHT
jgi:hypothetical protein